MARRVLLILVASSVLFVALVAAAANVKRLNQVDTKLVKNFDKINEFLERKVSSDDLQANVEKARELLKDKLKLSLLLDRSFKDSLRLFVSLPETIRNATTCNYVASRVVLEKCDRAMLAETSPYSSNNPLRRIDRILEEVAYKNARLCRLNGARPDMRFTFKQVSYDRINDDLVDATDERHPTINMQVARDLLGKLDNQDGSYALAFKQLVSMEEILHEDSCDEQGLEIVMKNDLATRGESRSPGAAHLRRITRVVRGYMVAHAEICRPIYEQKCLARLTTLDTQTFHSVLGLASAYYVAEAELNRMVKEIKEKRVGLDIVTTMVSKSDNLSSSKPFWLIGDKLFRYLEATSQHDPRKRFFDKVVDEREGKLVFRGDKVRELYEDYISRPCEKFLDLIDADMEVYNYLWEMIQSREKEEVVPLNFHLLRSAYQSCREVTRNREFYIEDMVERLN